MTAYGRGRRILPDSETGIPIPPCFQRPSASRRACVSVRTAAKHGSSWIAGLAATSIGVGLDGRIGSPPT